MCFNHPPLNLACDEALLLLSEEKKGTDSFFRIWQPQRYAVICGISNTIISEVNVESCKKHGIPIYRRKSGGGAVLIGPGTLNFSFILPYNAIKESRNITTVSHTLLNMIKNVLPKPTQIKGLGDLTLNDKKIVGTAQRRLKHSFLFHGSLLIDMDIQLIQEVLNFPSRTPDYRKNRNHNEFVTNLGINADEIKVALFSLFNASSPPSSSLLTTIKNKSHELESTNYPRLN